MAWQRLVVVSMGIQTTLVWPQSWWVSSPSGHNTTPGVLPVNHKQWLEIKNVLLQDWGDNFATLTLSVLGMSPNVCCFTELYLPLVTILYFEPSERSWTETGACSWPGPLSNSNWAQWPASSATGDHTQYTYFCQVITTEHIHTQTACALVSAIDSCKNVKRLQVSIT